ncbi:MAG: hypothetical protein CMJ49_13395 [Planctomycetaceae bacterium]|nr:hypothetical protein [Planctomycetaceae bacterium]
MSNAALPVIDVAYGDDTTTGLPVSIGVPFPKGILTDPANISVTAPTGDPRPAHCRPFVNWPDGSARWALISFGAHQAGEHVVSFDPAPAPDQPVTIQQDGDTWTLSNGKLTATLAATGPGPIQHIESDGHTYLNDPAKLTFRVDDANTQHESKRTIRVLEQSPLRARVRIEGEHVTTAGLRKLNYRLDVELWTGWTTLRLDYHFFNLEPNSESIAIDRMALDVDWSLTGQTERHFLQQNYDLFYVSRHVFNPNPVSIMADEVRGEPYVEDPAMLLDDIDYPAYLHPPLIDTGDWLGVAAGGRAVYAQMQDFHRTQPNRLLSRDAQLGFEFWPAGKPTLDLPQGRSHRQVMAFAFVQSDEASPQKKVGKVSNAPRQAPQGVAAALGALIHEGRAAVKPDWIAHCAEFEQDKAMPHGQHVRFERTTRGFASMQTPNTKFDVGDTDSFYKGAYSCSGSHLVHPLSGFPEIPRVWPTGQPSQTYLDCHEPVWLNNEYDCIHAFCGELMRTGSHNIWPMLRLNVRHNIEVDFLHYSDHKWIHRATPAHSARHTSTGAYPSHFWTQGLLEYYCLTADPDVLEVALALGDKTIEFFDSAEQREVLWGFNREIGWSILLLSHLVDITGEQRFVPLLEEMVQYLMDYDRVGFTGAVNLSAGDDRKSLHRQIIDGIFGYCAMIDGVDHYATMSGRADVDAWLKTFILDLADAAVDSARQDGHLPGIKFAVALAVGHERTADPRFMALTEAWLDDMWWNQSGNFASPTAYRAWTRIVGHAHRTGFLDQYEFPGMRKLQGVGSHPTGS